MKNTMIDLLLLAVPFILLSLVGLSLISSFDRIMDKMHLKLILLVLAAQVFGLNLIMIRNSREITRIMSLEALRAIKIPETIFDESDLSFGYFYQNDGFIWAYSVLFFLIFCLAFWLVFLKE